MFALRRFLLASLLVLTGLVVGCQSKSPPGRSQDTKPAEPGLLGDINPEPSLQKKLKQAQEEPEGPSLK
jgi:hypothetical protein